MTGRPTLIAFGSCRKQRLPQPVWGTVASMAPDAWLWTGDYVYQRSPATKETLRRSYEVAGHTELALRASVPLIDGEMRTCSGPGCCACTRATPADIANLRRAGVYDDHDYGLNDGGKHWELRDYARQLFLDRVVDAPIDSMRRSRAGGMYGSRVLGRPPHQVKVLFLDTRYGRDDYVIPSPGGSSWLPKPGLVAAFLRVACAVLGVGASHAGDILGSEEQWAWLEAELVNSTAAVHLIVSSVQVGAAQCQTPTTGPGANRETPCPA